LDAGWESVELLCGQRFNRSQVGDIVDYTIRTFLVQRKKQALTPVCDRELINMLGKYGGNGERKEDEQGMDVRETMHRDER
jgi:hypothetical protein